MARYGKALARKRQSRERKHEYVSTNEHLDTAEGRQPSATDVPNTDFECDRFQCSAKILRLPAELRNQIYEQVLTAHAQFHYRPAHATQIKIHPLSFYSNPLMVCLVDQRGTSNHRNTSRPFRAQLTVLTGCEHTKTLVRNFNQLQFVNRQLRQETKGLEFRYNNIAFTAWSSSTRATLEQMCTFGRNMRSYSTSWLRSVTLIPRSDLIWDLVVRQPDVPNVQSEHFKAYANFLWKTASFCKKNPQLQLSYAITPSSNPDTFGEIEPVNPDSGYCGFWTFVVLGMLASIAFDRHGAFAQSINDKIVMRSDFFVQHAEAYGRTFADRGIFNDVKNLTFYQGNPQQMKSTFGPREVRATDFFGNDGHVLRVLTKEVWATWATHWLRHGIRPS